MGSFYSYITYKFSKLIFPILSIKLVKLVKSMDFLNTVPCNHIDIVDSSADSTSFTNINQVDDTSNTHSLSGDKIDLTTNHVDKSDTQSTQLEHNHVDKSDNKSENYPKIIRLIDLIEIFAVHISKGVEFHRALEFIYKLKFIDTEFTDRTKKLIRKKLKRKVLDIDPLIFITDDYSNLSRTKLPELVDIGFSEDEYTSYESPTKKYKLSQVDQVDDSPIHSSTLLDIEDIPDFYIYDL